MAASEASDTDAATAPAPLNLRTAAEENKECGNCVYFKGGAHCTKFPPLCVSDEWVCDAWKAGGKDTDDDAPVQAKTVRGTQRELLARLNARSRPQPQ